MNKFSEIWFQKSMRHFNVMNGIDHLIKLTTIIDYFVLFNTQLDCVSQTSNTISNNIDLCLDNPLTFCYLIMKILYVVNCFFQFYLLTVFLSFPFHTFGIEWLMETIDKLGTRTNIEVRDSKWFPRVVMCDFMVRQLGSNPHWM